MFTLFGVNKALEYRASNIQNESKAPLLVSDQSSLSAQYNAVTSDTQVHNTI